MGKQKRSYNTYQKINTLFYRDENNIIMSYDDFAMPELEDLKECKFRCEEKVDGTNIRIEVTSSNVYEQDYQSIGPVDVLVGVRFDVKYRGKTDNADIPKLLMECIEKKYNKDVVLNGLGLKEFIPVEEFEQHNWTQLNPETNMVTINADKVPAMYTIYCEGYGVKIQKCGGNYLQNENELIGFDVKVLTRKGTEIWLLRKDVEEICNKMNMDVVPIIGYMTIPEAIEYVKKGYKSKVAKSNKDFIAEGLVCKTNHVLLNRMGQRIVFKLKTCDWNKYYAKYGTYDKVEQRRNPEYIIA